LSGDESDFSEFYSFKAPTEGIDTITNFRPSQDYIEISAGGFEGGITADDDTGYSLLTPDQFVLGTAATLASQRFIYNPQEGTLSFDKDGTGAVRQVQFATLTGAPEISNTNISVG